MSPHKNWKNWKTTPLEKKTDEPQDRGRENPAVKTPRVEKVGNAGKTEGISSNMLRSAVILNISFVYILFTCIFALHISCSRVYSSRAHHKCIRSSVWSWDLNDFHDKNKIKRLTSLNNNGILVHIYNIIHVLRKQYSDTWRRAKVILED